jgi:O-antigen/teichoic acid export membrane protein
MLLRQTFYYFIARGLPGIVNFAALAIFTRLLAPEEFGRYALVLAGVGLANVVLFQWLRMVVGRFYQANRENREAFLGGILALFLLVAVPVTGVGVLLGLLWPDPVWQQLLFLAVLLLLSQAWFELSLSLAQASVKPAWYGRLSGGKSVIYVFVGALLGWLGLGASAPLAGLIAAHILAFLLYALGAWKGVSIKLPAGDVLRKQLSYGLPLTVTFALSWVVSGSDRLIIAWLLDEQAVGMYSAGYDLVFQTLMLVLIIINTAAYPLAVNAMERGGQSEARQQLSQNGQLILAAAIAGCAGLVAIGPALISIVIGEAFRAAALAILPWIALAGAAAGIRAYHFDLAFQLGMASKWLLFNGALAAFANVGLNLILIPHFGILGAAWATLGAFLIALMSSLLLGRRVFQMPRVLPLFGKAIVVAVAVGWLAKLGTGFFDNPWMGLASGLVTGTFAGALACLLVDLAGVRQALLVRLSR